MRRAAVAAVADVAARRHYVYYRVDEQDLAAALDGARAGIDVLCAGWPALHAELLRRPGSAAGQVTLMEVFDAGPAGIDAAGAARIEATMTRHVAPWIRGARHVEVFDLLPP